MRSLLDHPAIPFVGRMLVVYIYATSGYAKIFGWAGNVAYMTSHHMPLVPVLLAAATVIEVGGSICLIVGYQARWAAFLLFVYTMVLTVMLHNYWAYAEPMRGGVETHFRKNIAIAGGLLFLAYCGPGRWSVDARSARATARS